MASLVLMDAQSNEKLNSLFLLGTLKASLSKDYSHTKVLCELLIEELRANNVKSEIIRLADYKILPGITARVEKKMIGQRFSKK